jgi:putative SOS response-associated peptidase YedK
MDAFARRARPQSALVDGEHQLFAFLTTEANAVVAPIHLKAMPVILTTPEGRGVRWRRPGAEGPDP